MQGVHTLTECFNDCTHDNESAIYGYVQAPRVEVRQLAVPQAATSLVRVCGPAKESAQGSVLDVVGEDGEGSIKHPGQPPKTGKSPTPSNEKKPKAQTGTATAKWDQERSIRLTRTTRRSLEQKMFDESVLLSQQPQSQVNSPPQPAAAEFRVKATRMSTTPLCPPLTHCPIQSGISPSSSQPAGTMPTSVARKQGLFPTLPPPPSPVQSQPAASQTLNSEGEDWFI
jgi:hypothetical protein